MQIKTAGMVGKLAPTERDQLIADITSALVAQQEQADVTKKLAERANQGKAIFAGIGAVLGLVAGCGIALIFMNDEWRAFQALKTLHDSSSATAIAFDHDKLVESMGLPDFATLALKTELPKDPAQIVYFGDTIAIVRKRPMSDGRPGVLQYTSSYGLQTGVAGVGTDRFDDWTLEKGR